MLEKFNLWVDQNQLYIVERKRVDYGEKMDVYNKEGNVAYVTFYDSGRIIVQGKNSELKQKIEIFIREIEVKPKKSAKRKSSTFNIKGENQSLQSEAIVDIDVHRKQSKLGVIARLYSNTIRTFKGEI